MAAVGIRTSDTSIVGGFALAIVPTELALLALFVGGGDADTLFGVEATQSLSLAFFVVEALAFGESFTGARHPDQANKENTCQREGEQSVHEYASVSNTLTLQAAAGGWKRQGTTSSQGAKNGEVVLLP